jgi:hypothetical protein
MNISPNTEGIYQDGYGQVGSLDTFREVGIVFRGIYTASYLRPWARVAYLILLRNLRELQGECAPAADIRPSWLLLWLTVVRGFHWQVLETK